MRDAAAVADDEQALVRRLQILVDGDLHVVEFDLNAVKQRIVVRRTGGDLVKRVDHLDDAVENALRDDQRQIARRSRQRGGDEGFVDALLRRALAADEIAEALHHHAAAQHIRKPCNGLAVAVGILERLGKVFGDEQGEVRVLGLLGRVLIAVAVDGHDAVRVFGHDRALRVHAERAHEILIFFGLVDDLALIKLVGQVLEDLGGQLDAHADVDAVGLRLDVQLAAHALHPFAAAAADGDDALLAGEASVIGHDLISAVRCQHLPHGRAEVKVDLRRQLGKEIFQHDKIDIRPEVPDGRVEQVQIALQTAGLERAVGRGIQLRVLAAVADVDLVDIVHQLHGLLLADIFIERAAEVIRQVIFSVGKRARAAEAVHDRARRTADAVLDSLPVNGTSALFERLALFKYGDPLLRTELRQLIRRENSAGACADDNDIILHEKSSFL